MIKLFRKKARQYIVNIGDVPLPPLINTPMRKLLYKGLYRFNFITVLHLSPLARGLMMLAAIYFTLVMIDPLHMLVSYALIFLALFLIIDLVTSFIFRPRVQLQRTLPEQCTATIPFEALYQLKNERSTPAFRLLLDNFSFPGLHFPEGKAQCESLDANLKTTLSTCIVLKKRGKHKLPNSYASSSFPFGIWCRGHFGKGSREILVLPASINVDHLDIPPGMARARETEQAHSRSGGDNMLEYSKVREYRPGDSPRLIHWPTYARLGEPVIVEYADNTRPEITLYLDLKFNPKWLQDPMKLGNDFEATVIVAASILRKCVAQGYHIKHLLCGSELHSFDARQNEQDVLNSCLEILAVINPLRSETPRDLETTKQVLFSLTDQAPIAAIFSTIDATRLTLARQINAQENASVVLISSSHNAIDSDGPNSTIRHMHAADVLKEAGL